MNDTYYGKKEIVRRLAKKTGVTKKDCDILVDATAEVLNDMLAECKGVYWKGFGKLIFVVRKPRTHFDIVAGQNMQTPYRYYPKFVPSPALKDKIYEHSVVEKDIKRGKVLYDGHERKY